MMQGGRVMVASIETDPAFRAGTARLLFEGPYVEFGPLSKQRIEQRGQCGALGQED
jgi:hypothetical protein